MLPEGIRDFAVLDIVNSDQDPSSSSPNSTFSSITPGSVLSFRIERSTLTAGIDQGQTLYAAFITGLGQIIQPVTSSASSLGPGGSDDDMVYHVEVPQSLGDMGTGFMLVFQDDRDDRSVGSPTLSDPNTVAGPAFLIFTDSGEVGAVSVQF